MQDNEHEVIDADVAQAANDPNAHGDRLDYVCQCDECGGVIAWMSSDMDKASLSRSIAKHIKDGLSVERMATSEARQRFGHRDTCSHKRRPKATTREMF